MITMKQNHSLRDITLHIEEMLDTQELSKLKAAIKNDAGVVSVGHSLKDCRLMVIMYNPEVTKSTDILHCVTNQGYHGELAGVN